MLLATTFTFTGCFLNVLKNLTTAATAAVSLQPQEALTIIVVNHNDEKISTNFICYKTAATAAVAAASRSSSNSITDSNLKQIARTEVKLIIY